MHVKAISVILENRPGRVAEVGSLLAANGLTIRALALFDMGDRSLLKLIADDHDKAIQLLNAKSYEADEVPVIAAEVPDHPGGLNVLLKRLGEASVTIRYLYPFLSLHHSNPVIIMEVDKADEAAKVLKTNWINLLGEEIYRI